MHVCLKRTGTGKPDYNAKRHKIRSRPLAGTAVASVLQGNTGHVQLRMTSDLLKMTGLLESIPGKGGGCPGISLGLAPLVTDPQEAKEMPASRESCRTHRG